MWLPCPSQKLPKNYPNPSFLNLPHPCYRQYQICQSMKENESDCLMSCEEKVTEPECISPVAPRWDEELRPVFAGPLLADCEK